MQHHHRYTATALATVFAVITAGCATLPPPDELDRQALAMIKASFRDQGIAKVDRIAQDTGQADAQASVKWPQDGRYIGDWREGERLAQNGRGMTWTDASAASSANGGQCYNCHEIDKKEISYGTIGPSLWNYGKTRGVKDVTDPNSAPIIQYTWAKIWNSKSYAACSNMPRFGHAGLLNEKQISDVMALILDPRSPVNQ